jgi:uncharacterized protein YjdB
MKLELHLKRRVKNVSGLCMLMFSLSIADAYSQTYGTLPMGGGGFVSGIIPSKTEKGLVYARTDVGGAYRWDTGSNQWISLLDWVSSNETGYLGVESLALDPSNSDNVYMAVGISYFNNGKSAILRSNNRGKSFSITDVTSLFSINGNGMGRNAGEKLAVDPCLETILYYGSRSNGLFKSTNSGGKWEKVSSLSVATTSSGNGYSFVLFDTTGSVKGSPTKTIIAGISRTGENIYISQDAGVSFTALSGGPTTLMPLRASLSSNRILYITYANTAGPWDPTKGQIWTYDIGNNVWKNITPAGMTSAFGGICVDPNNPQRVVATTINVYQSQGNTWGDLIYKSVTGGYSWKNLITSGYKFDNDGITWAKNGAAIHWAGSIEFDPFDTKRAWVISGNGVFLTENIDSSTNVWKFNVKGIEETVPYDLISIPNGPMISVVADYDGFRHTSLHTYPEQLTPTMGSTFAIAYAALNPKVIVRAGSKLYYSADTGKTWTQGTINGSQGYLAVSADGSAILHSPDGYISYRSTDNGKTWASVLGLKNSARIVADPVNASVFYSYYGNKMMVSVNRGKSFNATTATISAGGSKHIRTVPGFEGHVWVALASGGLTRSVDYGSTFTSCSSVTSCSAIGIGKAAPNAAYPTLFIWGSVTGGSEGLYFSTDEGATWNRMNDSDHEWGGLANGQFVAGDMNNLGYAYVSTAGLGIPYACPDYMLSASTLTIPVSGTTQIMPTVLNNEAVSWSWSSSDEAVAKVDGNGLVTGISMGQAIIKATTTDGKSVKIAVKVANAVTNLSISPKIDNIGVNQEVQLTATISPTNATNKTVTWTSVNPAVATVSQTGLIKGLTTGSTLITASVDGKTVSMPLVVGVQATGISINLLTDTIKINGTVQLTASLLPANVTDKKINWISGKAAVATVDSNGLVTGKAKGIAVISALSSDGSVVATCQITVSSEVAAINYNTDNDIAIYPNPLKNNKLFINLNKLSNISNIKIINTKGQTVLTHQNSNQTEIELDVDLNPGIYIVQFTQKDKTFTKKLVVE